MSWASTCAPPAHALYVIARWKVRRVNIDYRVEFDRHLYSVPYQLIPEQVEVRYTAATVKVFFKGRHVGLPPPTPRPRSVHHRRAHAERPPRPRRVDALATHWLRGEGRTRDRRTRHPHPRQPPPTRAGYPTLAAHHATGVIEPILTDGPCPPGRPRRGLRPRPRTGHARKRRHAAHRQPDLRLGGAAGLKPRGADGLRSGRSGTSTPTTASTSTD